EASLKSYTKLMNLYIRPHLGRALIGHVTAEEIQKCYRKLMDAKLSPQTVRHVHDLLNMVFKLAVLRRKVSGSPMAGVTPPRIEEDGKAKAMAAVQVRMFLDAAKGSRFEYLFKLAFHAGCRPGELLALKWDDLDEDAATLRIDQNIVFRKTGDWYLKSPKT